MKSAFVLMVVLACSACGGGSNSNDEGLSPNPTTVPVQEDGDIYERTVHESAKQAGRKFSHRFISIKLDSGLTASAIDYSCEEPPVLYENILRREGVRVNSSRVCLDTASAQNCYFPGVRSLRHQGDMESVLYNAVRLWGSKTDEVASFEISFGKPGSNSFDELIHSSWSPDPECNDSSGAVFSFADIEGVWDVYSYWVNGSGTPVIEDSAGFVCAGTSCTSTLGMSFTEIAEDTDASSEGLYYSGLFTSYGAAYENARGILSKTKNMLSILACPDGTVLAEQLQTCRFVIAERR